MVGAIGAERGGKKREEKKIKKGRLIFIFFPGEGRAGGLGSSVPGREGIVWFEILSMAQKFGKLDAPKAGDAELGVGVCAALICSPSVQALGCATTSFFNSLCTTFACLVSGDGLCSENSGISGNFFCG